MIMMKCLRPKCKKFNVLCVLVLLSSESVRSVVCRDHKRQNHAKEVVSIMDGEKCSTAKLTSVCHLFNRGHK